jgi:hypothetical protein
MTFISDTNDPIYQGTAMYTGDINETNEVLVMVGADDEYIVLGIAGPDVGEWPHPDTTDYELPNVPNHHGYWIAENAMYDQTTGDFYGVKWRPARAEDFDLYGVGAPVMEDTHTTVTARYANHNFGIWADGSLWVWGASAPLATFELLEDGKTYVLVEKERRLSVEAESFAEFVKLADMYLSTEEAMMHSAIAHSTYTHYKGDQYVLQGMVLDTTFGVPAYRYVKKGGHWMEEFTRLAHEWDEHVGIPAIDGNDEVVVRRFQYVS